MLRRGDLVTFVGRTSVDGVYHGPVTVPDSKVLLMGDDRERSIDSRSYGPVPSRDVAGPGARRLVLVTWGHCPAR